MDSQNTAVPADMRKAVANAQARLAIAGFQLEQMADGSFVVARWTMTRSLAGMPAVEAFMQKVGVA